MFSQELNKEVEELFKRYPKKVNVLLPLLHMVQKEQGYLSIEAMQAVADMVEVPVTHVEGVATFYTMYAKEPRGKNHLAVCTNISCMMKGGNEILEHVEHKLNVHAGESTADGKFFVEEVECLGACGYAPVMIVNDEYHEDLTIEQVDQIIQKTK